ncbi:MAG: 50S ribosomal protein L25 [Abitibacteriaceae bacterium]|nr:50S ribosomal protein L25 [Abditibacteriaceae bacterium]
MATHELTVQSRAANGKSAAKKLRREGLVPAVAYGHKEEAVTLAVDARQLRDLLSHHASHGLLTLKFKDGASPDLSVIIKALQRHPVRHSVNAVDFLRVSLDEEVTATVPIVLEGEPTGVKSDGGVLVQALHELEVSALPQNLPEQITVDVSALELNGPPIHIKEIALPQGVKAITDGEEPVAVVNPPKLELPEETAVAEGTEADAVPADHGTEGAGDNDGAEA